MYNLGTLGGTNSYGYGINAAGQVTGASDTTGDSATHAFLWKPSTPNGTSGTMHDLGSLGGTESNGSAINASGQVAGSSLKNGDAAYRAFLWKPSTPNGTSGTMYDLGTLGGTESFGGSINASGQVAGFSYTDRTRGLPRLSVDANNAERHQRHDAGPGNAGWAQQLQLQRRRRRSGGRRVRSRNELRRTPTHFCTRAAAAWWISIR